MLGQRRGRLVEDEQARVERERLDDLDDLLLRGREVADERPRAEADLADLLEQLRRPALHRADVDDPVARRLAVDEDVLRDGPVGEQVELLEDDRDAGGLGLDRVVEGVRLAVDQDLAGVGGMHAREHLHQRRLAGPVLADDRVDLAGAAVDVDAVQDLDAEEALADAAHLEQLGHAQTSTHAARSAEARTASMSCALRAPSANVGSPSGAPPPAIAAYVSATKRSKQSR